MEFSQLKKVFDETVRKLMPEHLKHLSWSKPLLKAHQTSALRHLLTHAKTHTKFYQQSLQAIDTQQIKLSDLTTIPIINKMDTLNHWDDFVAGQVITREQAENHLQKLRQKKITNPFYHDNYLLFATGGTSGHRGLFMWNIEDFANCSCLIYRYQVRDEKNKGIHGGKIATIVAPTWMHASLPLLSAEFDTHKEIKHFPATLPLRSLTKLLENFQPDQLIGYSSVIIELSHLANTGELKIQPSRVSTNSEPLNTEGRNSIRQAWGVEVNNAWGSTEAGIMGVEDDEHLGMWVCNDYCLIETVDHDLKPVTKSEETQKLIVTNLLNHTFPIIRYVVEDAVVIRNIADRTYQLAQDIQGRSDDWFSYQGIKVHPLTFRHVLGQEKDIIEYQVQQTRHGADIKIVTHKNINFYSIKKSLEQELQQIGLKDVKINIQTVKELPRYVETGKLKRFIPIKS